MALHYYNLGTGSLWHLDAAPPKVARADEVGLANAFTMGELITQYWYLLGINKHSFDRHYYKVHNFPISQFRETWRRHAIGLKRDPKLNDQITAGWSSEKLAKGEVGMLTTTKRSQMKRSSTPGGVIGTARPFFVLTVLTLRPPFQSSALSIPVPCRYRGRRHASQQ